MSYIGLLFLSKQQAPQALIWSGFRLKYPPPPKIFVFMRDSAEEERCELVRSELWFSLSSLFEVLLLNAAKYGKHSSHCLLGLRLKCAVKVQYRLKCQRNSGIYAQNVLTAQGDVVLCVLLCTDQQELRPVPKRHNHPNNL